MQPVVQPVGWTMQMSAAKRRLSGPARTLMTSLGWRAQQGGCVDSRRCGALDRNIFLRILIYFFILPLVAYDRAGWQKLGRSQNSTALYSTVLIYLFSSSSSSSSSYIGLLYWNHTRNVCGKRIYKLRVYKCQLQSKQTPVDKWTRKT